MSAAEAGVGHQGGGKTGQLAVERVLKSYRYMWLFRCLVSFVKAMLLVRFCVTFAGGENSGVLEILGVITIR